MYDFDVWYIHRSFRSLPAKNTRGCQRMEGKARSIFRYNETSIFRCIETDKHRTDQEKKNPCIPGGRILAMHPATDGDLWTLPWYQVGMGAWLKAKGSCTPPAVHACNYWTRLYRTAGFLSRITYRNRGIFWCGPRVAVLQSVVRGGQTFTLEP